MIWETSIDSNNAEQSFRELVDAWKQDRAKVFVLRGQDIGANPRAFYDSHFADIGRPVALAEDVILGSRDQQRTGEIWMEVRYDPQHPDAYRRSEEHTSELQSLMRNSYAVFCLNKK